MTKKSAGFSGRIGDTDIRLLRIFRAVADCGGFSAAEVELNMSVSAISIAIGDLEKRLGMKLCQRGRAGFALTEQGQDTYQAVLQLLSSLENFRTEVNAIHSRLRGELNIGITDNLVTMYTHMRVTNSLAALKRRGPEVQINIRMMPPVDIEMNVLDGRLHVGVIPSLKPVAGLAYSALYAEESQLYCGHLHPLYRLDPDAVTATQVLAEDAVVMSRGLPESARAFMQQMRPAATASDREGIAFLILSGEYIGFLPTHYAQRWVGEGRMRSLLPDHFHYQTRYSAITRRAARPNLILQTYMEELARAENDRPGF
jgi:DNA-binding transcriptional LysR family regulator